MTCSSNFMFFPERFQRSNATSSPGLRASPCRNASQLHRSAFRVPASIVEGFGRHSRPDRLHFLQIASSSLNEAGYCLHVAQRLRYISASQHKQFEVEVRKTSAPLLGLMKSLGREHP
jgi:four helix bundle protein